MRIKAGFALALWLLLVQGATAEERPQWSLEVKGGRFHSAMEEWSDFYRNDRYPLYAVALGYKVWRPLEVGVEVGYQHDEGVGLSPEHGTLGGEVDYKLFPVHLFLTLRGILSEDQWLVPYVGAAWSRYVYRIETPGQERISGGTDGHQYRAGLQLLLDPLDRHAAATIEREYGVFNTYLFLEMQETKAEIDGFDLGGTAYLAGFLLEF